MFGKSKWMYGDGIDANDSNSINIMRPRKMATILQTIFSITFYQMKHSISKKMGYVP